MTQQFDPRVIDRVSARRRLELVAADRESGLLDGGQDLLELRPYAVEQRRLDRLVLLPAVTDQLDIEPVAEQIRQTVAAVCSKRGVIEVAGRAVELRDLADVVISNFYTKA